jgi:glycosyltransferase involved in cell wall biosynthesis
MSSPKITIIVANYNNRSYILDCLTSITAQTFEDWETIIIDDASTDNSEDLILPLIKGDTRFTYVRNEKNLGYQSTLIKAIELSKAEIFGRLDPDDALKPDAVELSLKSHEENPDVGLVYTDLIFCDENLNEVSVYEAKQMDDLDDMYLNFHGEISHFATFKKNIYNKTEGINPYFKIAEDKDIYMKMCEVAPVKHLNKALYMYRMHSAGMSQGTKAREAFFWHWVAIIKMAERRNVEISDLFYSSFVLKEDFDNISKRLTDIKKTGFIDRMLGRWPE